MENTFSEAEMAMLLLDQKDLVQLGAMLALQAQFGTRKEDLKADHAPMPLAFDA